VKIQTFISSTKCFCWFCKERVVTSTRYRQLAFAYRAWRQSPLFGGSLRETKSGVWSATLRPTPRLLTKYFLMALPHSVWPWF